MSTTSRDEPSANELAEAFTSQSQLRAVYKQPTRNVVAKCLPYIDPHSQRFIELSPFLCLGTTGPDGLGDVTPRGGEPGFVAVLDKSRLAIPDRPGNNRLDSLGNVVERPGVGLLFLVPGFEETLRVNGLARVVTDETLMQRFTVDGKAPRSVLVVEVKEVYLHCAKAVRRAALWSPEARIQRSAMASAGQIFRDQLALAIEAETIDEVLDQDARDNLY